GEGARMWDVDGNAYLDFLGNFTSLIHGHAHPHITAAIAAQAAQGTAFPFPGEPALRLAEEIRRRVPSMERLRFCNSGTEAVMGAIRAARAFTGRSKVLKMEGGYHGSADVAQVSVNVGVDAAPYPQGKAQGPGVPDGVVGDVLVVPYNDLATLERTVRAHAPELAAVIIEPHLTAAGVIPAEAAFLAGARAVTAECGVPLIFDEIITLRLAMGGAQALYGITPDLTTIAKIIGGGLPVGAFGGRADIMATFDPRARGAVSHSGTFNGNAVTMAAGLAALELLTGDALDHINTLGEAMRAGMQRALDDAGVAACVTGSGSLAHVHFCRGPVRDYRDAQRGDGERTRLFHLALLERGVVCASRGMFATSTVMAMGDVETLVGAVGEVGREMARMG
ncbi:MAG TPA: aminotransferase class III-fold pyridoxal phosphate-dependent enzyme, partial [Gemmatimonadaceae bacterium]|nr:aminotransferase class III-fold pyridoxal phosphate-dependent enzyme [Gemmatimonadaceae bacterium]